MKPHKIYDLPDFEASDIFERLRLVDNHVFIFESLEGGHWTFLGYKPSDTLTLSSNDRDEQDFETFRKKLRKKKTLNNQKLAEFPPFTSGWVGYFGFDFFKRVEPKAALKSSDSQFEDADLMYFDEVLAYNHQTKKLWIFGDYQKTFEIINEGVKAHIPSLEIFQDDQPQFLFSKSQFVEAVEKVKHHIKEGDIFQAVISNYIRQKAKGSIFDVYKNLRINNPSPYMFFMSSDSLEIAGAAPETLVSVIGNQVRTFPLAGTRPRGKNNTEDEKFEDELLNDPKECAEHNMLVDLGRNDIGKISKIGTVEVTDYMNILKFSHVMHIGSVVKGVLQDGCDALDAIEAILPAGTLSGAPKIRAVQIIEEVEGANRGVFGGCVGYIDDSLNMDMCIAIRTAYKKGDYVYARAGAGIVLDSVPELEYDESVNKMKAVINAINGAAQVTEIK